MKISDHGKYITTLEYNKLTTENFDERFRQTNLANFSQKFKKVKIELLQIKQELLTQNS